MKVDKKNSFQILMPSIRHKKYGLIEIWINFC